MTAADIQAIRDALATPWNEPDRSADAEVQRLYKLCQRADDAIARLLAALEDAQKDAARYRWLKTAPEACPAEGPDLAVWAESSGDPLRGDAADAAIDAAMKDAP